MKTADEGKALADKAYRDKYAKIEASVKSANDTVRSRYGNLEGFPRYDLFIIPVDQNPAAPYAKYRPTQAKLISPEQVQSVLNGLQKTYNKMDSWAKWGIQMTGDKGFKVGWSPSNNLCVKYGNSAIVTRQSLENMVNILKKKSGPQVTGKARGGKQLNHSDEGSENVEKYDFGGYVTKANVRCSDGRVIDRNAFAHCDGRKVPLVFQHLRNDPKNIVGHAVLEWRQDGVYGYGKFNNSETAQTMKELVQHGDIDSMSIYANHLSQHGSNVVHGEIREVSLVVAGANPGAKIDNVWIQHSDDETDGDYLDDEAIITTGEGIEHGDIYLEIGDTAEEDDSDAEIDHADGDSQNGGKAATVKQVFDSLTEDQKILFYAMVGQALEEGAEDEEDVEQSDEDIEGGINMGYHAFENNGPARNSLSHEDRVNLFAYVQDTAKKNRLSFRDVLKDVIEHGDNELSHGITDIESLFPDYKSLNNPPAWLGEPEAWVNTVWNGTAKTPFSRIKSAFADITKDEARARGYIKGKKKIEEQFSLLKRVTGPQTVYKLQKLDRDDIIDITDFDVVAWLKSEMRMKLQEELSRAILIGDGRLASDESKIKEDCIRPILLDDPFYSLKVAVTLSSTMDSTDRANAVIDAAAYSMIDYKGSGGLTAFMSPHSLADMKVAKDKNGRRLYTSVSEIASALGVSNIVEVPLMKDTVRTDTSGTTTKYLRPLAIMVNLRDYNVGADRGGQTTMFDDFDIDYNKYAYLIETRCSGALIRPASAIVLETEYGAVAPTPPPSDDDDDDKSVG